MARKSDSDEVSVAGMWCEASPRFIPHPWFRGPHRQTIAGALLGRRPAYRAVSHTVTLADGDRLVAHEDVARSCTGSGRSVLLVHGLGGCHQSGYMQRVAEKLSRAGHRVFRLDQRGCGAGMALARGSLHAGRTDDLAAAAEFVARTCPTARLTVVGFSLGASIVLKWLGTSVDRLSLPQLDSAIAVAPPLDLQACSRNLSRGWNRIYDRNFTQTLCRIVRRRRRLVPEMAATDWPRAPRSLYEFDQIFTAPLGGFRDVDDYYESCSCLHDLPRVSVPTRILFSNDDPLIPADVYERARYSPTTRVYFSPAGGHLGFLAQRSSGSPDADWHWMDWRIVDWVREFDGASC